MIRSAPRNLLFVLLAVLTFAVLDFIFLGFMSTLDRGLADLLQKVRERQLQPDPAIVQLHIDERSLELLADELGRYPWPRAVHAELLQGLLAAEPAAVVFDIVFSDPDRDRPGSDDYFVEVATADPRIFFAQVLLENNLRSAGVPLDRFGDQLGYELVDASDATVRQAMTLPLPALAATGRLGIINFYADSDGVGRRYGVYQQQGGWRIPSLPAKVAQYLKYPVPDEAFINLSWSAHPGERVQHSYADVLKLARDNEIAALSEVFAGRVVVIGGNAPGLHDFRATPVAGDFPGTGILATAIENLKHESYLRRVPSSTAHVVAGGLLLLVFFLFIKTNGPLHGGILLSSVTLLSLAAVWVFLLRGWVLPVATPLMPAWLGYVGFGLVEYFKERTQRQRAEREFGRFLDKRVVDSLIDAGVDPLDTKPISREVTILFSDIRGFTTLSETRSPEEIVGILNRYFTSQVDAIFHNNGTIDKFIGDAIMAFWGAPLEDSDQASNAVNAALEMAAIAQQLTEQLAAQGVPFDIGIGIHSGPAVVGFIGSANRLDYTAIGDSVNLASRIEGQTMGRARILISDATRTLCAPDFDFTDHGSVTVKGRAEAVRLFEPRRKVI